MKVTVFAREVPAHVTNRSCETCLKPATHEIYKADRKGKPNLSSRVFRCENHRPTTLAG